MATQERIAEMAAEIVMEMDVGRVIRGYLLPSLNIESFDENSGERVWENLGDILAPFVCSRIVLIVIPLTDPGASPASPARKIA